MKQIRIRSRNPWTLYMPSCSSLPKITVSTGTTLRFPTFYSLKHEQSSSIQTIRPRRSMYSATSLLIMLFWPVSASPLCTNRCISTCMTSTHHTSSIPMCLSSVIGCSKNSRLLYDTLHGIGLGTYFEQHLQRTTPMTCSSASTSSCVTNYYSGLRP